MATTNTQETEVKTTETKPKRMTAAAKAAQAAADEAKVAAAQAEAPAVPEDEPKAEQTPVIPDEGEVKPLDEPETPATPLEPAKPSEEPKAPEAPKEAPAAPEEPVIKRNPNDPVTLRVKNNGPRSFEVYTKVDLPSGKTTEVYCINLRQANAVKSKFDQLNRLAKKNRYEVEEV